MEDLVAGEKKGAIHNQPWAAFLFPSASSQLRLRTGFGEGAHVSLIAPVILEAPPQAAGSGASSLALATLGRWPCLLHRSLAHATVNLSYSAREFQMQHAGG